MNSTELGQQAEHEEVLREMAGALLHRGPDDEGVFVDLPMGLGLAHRRLSILDLSEAGHQPMHSSDGRYVLVFNGEIYNHLELRHELGNRKWHGQSDTETVLACVEEWGADSAGLKACLQRWTGMFAMALWDQEEQVLTLIRDRLGIKPLYYGWMGKTLLFASELKAMLQHPEIQTRVSQKGLLHYLAYSCCGPDQAIYESCQQVRPGSLVQFKSGEREGDAQVEVYWDLDQVWSAPSLNDSFESHCADVHGLLKEAVSRRLLSDVPLGVFLSGGLDSSLVAALMQEQSEVPIKSFTMGFQEDLFNEADRASAIAMHLGTEHHELTLTAGEAMKMIREIPEYWDEPFADSSQIPSYLLARLTREHVTVCLSGDGGDEVFGGYNRYLHAPALWHQAQSYPYPLRRMVIQLMRSTPGWVYAVLFRVMPRLNPESKHGRSLESVIEKIAQLCLSRDGQELHERLCAIWSPEQLERLLPGAQWPVIEGLGDFCSDQSGRGLASLMMQRDMGHYLPNDILTKVDRASMAVGLETRVPLLDHHVVESMAAVPERYKVQEGRGKLITRAILKQYLPDELLEMPKRGFAIPLAEWLREPMRDWAEELLCDKRCRVETGVNYAEVDLTWKKHLKGQDHSAGIWNIMMLHAWMRRYEV